MESETTRYLALVIRRWWIIVLVAAIAGVGAYVIRSRQPETFVAEAKVFIGNAITTFNPDRTLLETSERLANTYEQIVKFSNVLSPVMVNFDIDLSMAEFRDLISTNVIQNTPLLSIQVEYDSPEMASNLANAIADSLIENGPAELTPDQLRLLTIQQAQIDALNQQISEAQAQLIEIGKELIDATNPDRIVELTAQRNRIREQLQTDQANFTLLSQSFSSLSDRTNRLEVLERAQPPVEPSGLSPIVIGAAGGVTGALLATATILFFGYIDNKIRTEAEARRLLNMPVIGLISGQRGYSAKALNQGIDKAVKSGLLEQYRTALANMLLSQDTRERERVYLIASPERREGRSFTTAHLAAAAASTGLRVLLIDADLRNPIQHDFFGIPNNDGVIALVTLINGKPELLKKPDELKQILGKHIKKTPVENVDLIPSGANHSSKAALPNLDEFGKCVSAATALGYDLVLVDSAASIATADSYVLAAALDASIVLLIDAGRTKRESAVKTKEQFTLIGRHLSGIIINRI